MGAGDKVTTVEEMDRQRREQTPRRQRLERCGTGAPTDANIAAGQQCAGGASQCEAPAGWNGGEEDGDSAGDQRGRGEGAMGRRSGRRSEGAAGTSQGSATQEVRWATPCRMKLSPGREA